MPSFHISRSLHSRQQPVCIDAFNFQPQKLQSMSMNLLLSSTMSIRSNRPSIKYPIRRKVGLVPSHYDEVAYRPLERFDLSFSLQSSQYHLAGKEISNYIKRHGVTGRGTHHYPWAQPSSRHTANGTIPSRSCRHHIPPSLHN